MFRLTSVKFWFIFQLAFRLLVASKNLNLSHVIIRFDPYVSVLDLYERGRYKTDELVPLISKVATRFTKIMVELDHSRVYLDPTKSISLSGYAVAKYNCLDTTQRKIKLYLNIRTDDCTCRSIEHSSQNATSVADEINSLCSETLDTIFFQSSSPKCPSLLSKCGKALSLSDRYEWGEVIPFSDYCQKRDIINSDFIPAIVALDYADWEDAFKTNVTTCKTYKENLRNKPNLLKYLGFLDTNRDMSMNLKGFVGIWQRIANEQESNFLVMGSFDVLYNTNQDTVSMSNSGWWYLEKDPGTTNTSEFIFQEKINVAVEIDREENLNSLPWKLDTKFNKTTTGIVFQNDLENIVKTKDFCRLISFLEFVDLNSIVNSAITLSNFCGETFQLLFLISNMSAKNLKSLNKFKREQVTLLIPLDKNVLPYGFDMYYSELIKESGFSMGYYIDIDYCGHYSYLDTVSKKIIDDALADKQSSINIFHYELYKDWVNLGATRMFRHRNVIFDKCKELVFQNRNKSSQVGFVLKGFYKETTFYDSKWAMKNYARYVDLKSKWAEKQKNVVVFLGPDQDQTYDGDYGRSWESVGWYSYNDFVERKGYRNKSEQTLKINHDSKIIPYFGLTKIQFIVVICSILVFFLSVMLVLMYFVHRFRKTFPMTYEECKTFFNGRPENESLSENVPNDVKYDRVTYEVSDSDFTVNTKELLGAGEFGIVCRGTVTICDVEIQVAVKTTNPQKIHKTMLNGLLSEIKVLSYVGRHPNIIRLLGANTSSLKTGKVFVFIELCDLGSLRNVLLNMRAKECRYITKIPVRELKGGSQQSSDLSSISLKPTLNASLSNEFYRWSQEICSGMEYLTQKHVVHADLSTRNILLNLRREVKICDFGLSRRMYNYENYVKSEQEPMPWRWMAPESLKDMVYTEKTDVWAYGITLWEIYSFGSLPYPGLTWDDNFVRMLEEGLVPSQPDFEENNMYNLMKSCWKILPQERPTFVYISSILNYSEII